LGMVSLTSGASGGIIRSTDAYGKPPKAAFLQ